MSPVTTTATRTTLAGPGLAPGQVHLWSIRLTASPAAAMRLEDVLSFDETIRAARFAFDDDRCAFALRRAALRLVLAGYLGSPARDLRFEYGPQGKPVVPGCPLAFNTSHSHGTALIAVGAAAELGVDIEKRRPLDDAGSIARRFFTAAECADWISVPNHLRTRAFFDCWTRKEAFIKALGSGLSMPLDSFRVSLLPDQPAAILEINGSASAAEEWSMLDVSRDPGFSGSLAIQSKYGPPSIETFLLDSLDTCFETGEHHG